MRNVPMSVRSRPGHAERGEDLLSCTDRCSEMQSGGKSGRSRSELCAGETS